MCFLESSSSQQLAQCFTHHRNPGNPRDYHRGQFPTLDTYFTTITFLGGSPNFTGCILYRFIYVFYYSFNIVNNLSTASNGSWNTTQTLHHLFSPSFFPLPFVNNGRLQSFLLTFVLLICLRGGRMVAFFFLTLL